MRPPPLRSLPPLSSSATALVCTVSATPVLATLVSATPVLAMLVSAMLVSATPVSATLVSPTLVWDTPVSATLPPPSPLPPLWSSPLLSARRTSPTPCTPWRTQYTAPSTPATSACAPTTWVSRSPARARRPLRQAQFSGFGAAPLFVYLLIERRWK